MKWGDVAKQVGKLSPVVGGLLAGKLGEAAGEALAGLLGVEATPDAVADAVRNDPQAALAVRKMELEHDEAMARMGHAERLADIDRRAQEVAAANATIQAEYANGTTYSRETRPWIARRSFVAGTVYVLVAEAARLIGQAWGADFGGADLALAGALYGPAGFYLTMRTADSFSRFGRTGAGGGGAVRPTP